MSGLVLRPATASDGPRVAAFLHNNMNRKIAPDRWRRIVDYPWAGPSTPNRGHLLEDRGGAVLGFMGSVHAWRLIDGQPRRIVNLTGWYVDKQARGAGHGLALIRAAMADGGDAYTLLTNSANTLDMVQALGYRLLDEQRYLWRRDDAADAPRPDRLAVGASVRLRACPRGRRLIDDHQGLAATPVLIEAAGQRVTALFSVTLKGDDETWWDLLAATDPPCVARFAGALAAAVLTDEKSVVSIDARFAPAPPDAVAGPVPPTRLAWTRDLPLAAIDHAYSEIPLMALKLD